MSTRDLTKKLVPVGVVLIIAIIVIMKIYFPINGTLICTYKSAPGDTQADYTYTATYKLWKVKKLETKVVIKSNKKEVLEQMEKETKEAANQYSSLSFYDTRVLLEGKKLTTITTIDYKDIDYNALAAVEGKKKVEKGSLSIHTIKKTYKNIGAKCKYK